MKTISSISSFNFSTKYTAILLCIILAFTAIPFSAPCTILVWDVFGYYLYLPLIFIYHDLGIHNYSIIDTILNTYHNSPTFYQGTHLESGEWIIRYSSGMAIMYSPFFFVGHLIAKIFGYPADGFSSPYQYSILIGSLIYTFIGIVFLRKILLRFFSEKVSAAVMVIIVLGTNYFLHTSMDGQGAMTHNYLFTLYTIITWYTIKWHEYQKIKFILPLSIACGLAALCRPTEIVCVLIPLCWNICNKRALKEKLQLLLLHQKQVFLFAVILISLGSIQFIYWKIFTGHFIFDSYANPGEGLEFVSPYILQVLFSFRKGWIIYTPVMIFSLIGFYYLYKKNKNIFPSIFIYFLVNFYIVASWSCWWYAESFGQRALIPSYAILAIPLGYFINVISEKKIYKLVIGILITFFILLNLFQSWQITHGIIDPSRTTRQYYFRVFGKTSVTDEDKKFLLVNRPANGNEIFRESDYTKTLSLKLDYEMTNDDTVHYSKDIHYSGNSSYMLDSVNIFSPALEAKFKNITDKDHAWLRIRIWIYPIVDPSKNPSFIVAAFHHEGKPYKYKAIGTDKMNLKLNTWNLVSFDYLTPEVRNKNDNLGIYVWHTGKQKIFVDNIEVDVYELKFEPSIF